MNNHNKQRVAKGVGRMRNMIYCKTVSKGIQAFYLCVGSKRYYLFEQNYKVSNKEVYETGKQLDEIGRLKSHWSAAVRKTAEKLYAYIPYIEKEYGVAVFNKTQKKKCIYSRKNFHLYDRYAMSID